jgi:predicted aldo/keto reductase-like oxidoreductase
VIYRRFGKTELQLPVLSCGGMRYQQSWSRGATVTAASQGNLEATIDRALELGINHIETARGYGTSEAQLGQALARHPRDRYLLQTKVAPTENPRDFERNLEESFALLRVETVDLFSLHGLNNRTQLTRALRPGGCLEVAERFQRQGRIRHLGFSTHAPTALILELIESGRFAYLNLHYYYIFQDNQPAVAAAAARDMGVFIISPTDKGGRLQAPSARMRALCAPLEPMVFNDLFCLAQPEIHTLSVGAARPSDFDAHVGALASLDRAAALVEPIARRLEAAYQEAVGPAFARRWREGLREWDELPGQVNVRRILWLRNLVRAFDLIDFAQERYAAMSPDDHWVPGARAADLDDAALVGALPASPFCQELPRLLREAHAMLYNPSVVGGP